jgi:methylated-DNA-[protein]-cysteine S-methyltransferase
MIYTCSIDTPLGTMTAAEKEGSLIGLWFLGQKYYPSRREDWIREHGRPVFTSLRKHLIRYFSGEPVVADIRLAPSGSAFQRKVWELLLQIPVGQVTTYGQIAKSIAQAQGLSSMSAQAVGGAVGHNPISILIPCHRVVGSGGKLTGYAGGIEKKAELLRIEKVNCDCGPFRGE